MTTTTALPRIVRFLHQTDSGEFGADNCAHCGAKCRYQQVFMGDDGQQHRAAAGCIKRYKVTKLAEEERRIDERRKQREQDGYNLASWDLAKLEAIEQFYAGMLTEQQAENVIRNENNRRRQWQQKRGRR